MPILSESSPYQVGGKWYKISKISHQSATSTFLVDQSAVSATVTFPVSGGPTASLAASDSNFEKTVTLSGHSSEGTIEVLTVYNSTPSSVKPTSRA